MKKIISILYISLLSFCLLSCKKNSEQTTNIDVFKDFQAESYSSFKLYLTDEEDNIINSVASVKKDRTHLQIDYHLTAISYDRYTYNFETGIAVYTNTVPEYNDNNYYFLVDDSGVILIYTPEVIQENYFLVSVGKEYDEDAVTLLNLLNYPNSLTEYSHFRMALNDNILQVTKGDSTSLFNCSLNKPNSKVSLRSITNSTTNDFLYDCDDIPLKANNIYTLIDNVEQIFDTVSDKKTETTDDVTTISFNNDYYSKFNQLLDDQSISSYKEYLEDIQTTITIENDLIKQISLNITELFNKIIDDYNQVRVEENIYLQFREFVYDSTSTVSYRVRESANIFKLVENDFNIRMDITKNNILNKLIF